MGENPKYRANAYWPLFDSITEKYYEPYDKTRQSSCYESLFGLFNDFKNYINNKYNIDFNFPNLFNRADKRDFIGLPIFQSMISAKDRCILTQKFYEYKNKYSTLLDYCPQIAEGSNYSNVFKKIRDNSEYNKYLIDRVKSIAQSWDGCVYEYDNIKSERQRTIIPIIYQYKIDINGNLKFYLTTNNLNKFDISFKNFKLNLNNPRESLSNKDISINEISYPILNTKMKIARTKSDYILFIKHAHTNLYTEVSGNNKIVVGDIFSIIAPMDFFNHTDNIDSLERVISSYDEQSSYSINNDLCLLHNAVAGNYDNKFVYIDKKNKITFSKGLKLSRNTQTVEELITSAFDAFIYYGLADTFDIDDNNIITFTACQLASELTNQNVQREYGFYNNIPGNKKSSKLAAWLDYIWVILKFTRHGKKLQIALDTLLERLDLIHLLDNHRIKDIAEWLNTLSNIGIAYNLLIDKKFTFNNQTVQALLKDRSSLHKYLILKEK